MRKKICAHLNKIKDQPQNGFTIGEEVLIENSSERYFEISYSEMRCDQEFMQTNPRSFDREGYLKIDIKGNISLQDSEFKPYCSSKIFYFNFKKNVLMHREIGSLVHVPTFGTRCFMGLLFFSTAMMASHVIQPLNDTSNSPNL